MLRRHRLRAVLFLLPQRITVRPRRPLAAADTRLIHRAAAVFRHLGTGTVGLRLLLINFFLLR